MSALAKLTNCPHCRTRLIAVRNRRGQLRKTCPLCNRRKNLLRRIALKRRSEGIT